MRLNICYALNDGYVPYCGASMVSLLENNPSAEVAFHILTDHLNEISKEKLKEWIRPYNATIQIYQMDDSRLSGQKTTWSKYGWYRIFASDVISSSVKKLLYLDCDTIVTGNITDIFLQKNSEWSLAAVEDYMTIFPNLFERVGYSQTIGYFCSGILLMNLDYFRKHNLSDKILRFAIDNPDRILFPDQDALNCVCKDTKIQLPLKYGILDPFYRDERFVKQFRDEVCDSIKDPRIVHYAGCAPWISESNYHYFYDEFWKYAAKIGGIKKSHCCKGLSLIILTAKRYLGRIGLNNYKRFLSKPKPYYHDIIKMLNN